MITLAVYYAIADLILLLQILMYNRKNALSTTVDASHLSPATPLLESFEDEEDDEDEDEAQDGHHHHHHHHNKLINPHPRANNQNKTTHGTFDLEQQRAAANTGPNTSSNDTNTNLRSSSASVLSAASSASSEAPPMPLYKTILINTLMVAGVFAAGIVGWMFSEVRHAPAPVPAPAPGHPVDPPQMEFDFWGQVFGWGCAALYLGSRVPQILLNFERKSVEGISFLFFLFACLGNLTYVISILALDTSTKYLLINASWLAGSFGTLFLDFIIFVQFWMYNKGDEDEDESDLDSDETQYN